jgi:hypothetical protein
VEPHQSRGRREKAGHLRGRGAGACRRDRRGPLRRGLVGQAVLGWPEGPRPAVRPGVLRIEMVRGERVTAEPRLCVRLQPYAVKSVPCRLFVLNRKYHE